MRKGFIFLVAFICLVLLSYTFIPFHYITPHYSIEKEPIGYNLTEGYMGLKVYEVRKVLNLSLEDIRYDDETIEAIKNFQLENDLEANGIVDLNTWLALGLNEKSWYDLEIYITPCLVDEKSTYEERIQAMIDTAHEYIGTNYIVGASGKPQSGVDCSGSIMQVMYSVGLDPEPISPLRHVQSKYEYESYSLWKHKNIKHYSYKDRLPGDLVFFMNSKGKVNHVSLYIGNNQVIEATGNHGVVLNTLNEQRVKKIKCIGRLIDNK